MTISGASERVLNHPIHKELDKKLDSLYGWGTVISRSEEDKSILASHLLQIIWQATPITCKKEEIKDILRTAFAMCDEHSDGSGNALNMVRKAMDSTVPVHSECEIVINTVCGESRTIVMTQEVTSIEYMGVTLNKDSDGDFCE